MFFVEKSRLGATYVEKAETEETSSFLVCYKITDCSDDYSSSGIFGI